MMLFKRGVSIKGLRPEALLGMILCDQIFKDEGWTFTVTSCTDSIHSEGSLHYKGLAFDVRTKTLSDPPDTHLTLKAALAPLGFDVVLEKDHLHLEWDEKKDAAIRRMIKGS